MTELYCKLCHDFLLPRSEWLKCCSWRWCETVTSTSNRRSSTSQTRHQHVATYVKSLKLFESNICHQDRRLLHCSHKDSYFIVIQINWKVTGCIVLISTYYFCYRLTSGKNSRRNTCKHFIKYIYNFSFLSIFLHSGKPCTILWTNNALTPVILFCGQNEKVFPLKDLSDWWDDILLDEMDVYLKI